MRLLFGPHFFNGRFPSERRAPVREQLKIDGLHRQAAAGILAAPTRLVGLQAAAEVAGPSGVQGTVPAPENIYAWLMAKRF